jgi:excisionase family DNA binding protein
MPRPLPPPPIDATLTVTRAAQVLGVHPNTIRSWSEARRIRHYRINARGDRRYRLTDLQRFMDLRAAGPDDPPGPASLRGPDYERMSTWAAQLQSIQKLGSRLSRLTSVREIGLAIATELHELIDYHNVRVYRLYGDELVPVAMQGQLGEYVDETPDQLRVQIGDGITGWVGVHKIAQYLPDASADARTGTVPGTEPGLDESMLLAPMMFEDELLGVLVLSKLGLRQFTEDDLRLLEIYASLAAQAMRNADTTEQLREQSMALERQLVSQRALIQISESILRTLDPRAVLDQIADRLGILVGYDRISIERYERATGTFRPLAARGTAPAIASRRANDDTLAAEVISRNEAIMVHDLAGTSTAVGASENAAAQARLSCRCGIAMESPAFSRWSGSRAPPATRRRNSTSCSSSRARSRSPSRTPKFIAQSRCVRGRML